MYPRVLLCERLETISMSNGDNGDKVQEENPVLVQPCPSQFQDGLT
jgi:hypothetical protein